MGFDYSLQEMVSGYTIPILLDGLPGSPVVHIEHLGPDNRTLLAEQIATANATLAEAAKATKKRIGKKQSDAPPVVDESWFQNRTASRRETLIKHVVRKLEATHTDGTAATDADIPAWVNAIPKATVDLLYELAEGNANFFRPSEPKDIAKK